MAKTKESKKQEEHSDIPESLQDESVGSTRVRKLKDVISERLDQLRDLATLEVLAPVESRMRERLKSIQEQSKAKSVRIRNHWKTTPPKMHIHNLQGKKISNDEAEISFGVYDSDEKGNKKLYKNEVEVEMGDGTKQKRTTSAQYKIAYEVRETIKSGKPIAREITYMGDE